MAISAQEAFFAEQEAAGRRAYAANIAANEAAKVKAEDQRLASEAKHAVSREVAGNRR